MVPLLVLALLPELREDLLVKLTTLGLPVLPPLGVLRPVNLFLPLKKLKVTHFCPVGLVQSGSIVRESVLFTNTQSCFAPVSFADAVWEAKYVQQNPHLRDPDLRETSI